MKFALICCGNEESYGLLFVGGELLEFNQEIKYFDAEKEEISKEIIEWFPDFICFSPMSTFYPLARTISKEIKKNLPNVSSVFGGHHAFSFPEIIEKQEVDIVVVGPVRGSIERILKGENGIIKTCLTTPDDMPMPARKQYYKDIPRMANRYRKVMLSTLGCPWNCSYCSSSSSHIIDIHGAESYKRYYRHRRSIDTIIKEAKEILKLGKTYEIEWSDDEIFSGYDVDTWVPEFANRWEKEINLPLYLQTTSVFALKVSDEVLRSMKNIVNCIGLGIQAIRPESLKIYNRSWDSEEKMKKAYDRYKLFGYSVNMQAIIGLPVDDPVEDAIETIKGLQRIGAGSICSIYPLQIYPGTNLEKYCKDNNIEINDACTGDTNTGIPNIKFSSQVTKRLRNLSKLGTFFVKYNIDEKWIRILMDVDFDIDISKEISMNRYYECVMDRLRDKGEEVFDKIKKTTIIRY